MPRFCEVAATKTRACRPIGPGSRPLGPTSGSETQTLRSTNKTIHPPRVDPWPLQNLLRCSLCGGRFRCYYARGKRRFYRCKGRQGDSPHVLRTGVRCPADSLLAEDVENEVLYDLLQALSHATNFKAALESNITDLQGRVADLERDLAPVQRELDQVEGELRRMGVDRVRGVVTEADIDQLRRSALERKEHLEARLEVLGPGRLEELERTRAILAAVTDELNSADSAPEWWLEYQVYTRILPPELVDEYDGKAIAS